MFAVRLSIACTWRAVKQPQRATRVREVSERGHLARLAARRAGQDVSVDYCSREVGWMADPTARRLPEGPVTVGAAHEVAHRPLARSRRRRARPRSVPGTAAA